MPTFKGNSIGPAVQEELAAYDPATGRSLRRTWKGTKTACLGLLAELEEDGAAYQMSKADGPYYLLTATYATQAPIGNDEAPVRWTISTEVLQKSIFTLPVVANEMENYADPTRYRENIEEVARDSTKSLEPAIAALPYAPLVLRSLRRGGDDWETEYLTLTRSRTVDITVPTKMSVNVTRKIFTTAQLGVPASVAFVLPTQAELNALDTPAGSVWGWRLRGHSSEHYGIRIEQRHEFVLAAWDTLKYEESNEAFTG